MLAQRKEARTDTVADSGNFLAAGFSGAYRPVDEDHDQDWHDGHDHDFEERPCDESKCSIAAVAIFSSLPAILLLCLVAVVLGLVYPRCASWLWLYCRGKALVQRSDEAAESCGVPPSPWVYVNFGMLLYVLWSFFLDPAARTGYRFSSCFRNSGFWHAFSLYFPVELVGAPLNPEEGPFVLGYHPHGIISVGAFAAIGTNGCDWADGPGSMGVEPHLLTLPINFRIPFIREIFLSLGLGSSAKETFRSILKKGRHKAVCVVVGGAEESLASGQGTYDLTLVKRKGFVREALISRASLVPCFGFGETDIYSMSQGAGCASRLQKIMKKTMGFTLPMFSGRVGPMPYPRRIIAVLGRTIRCPEVPADFDPKSPEGEALINKFHNDYCHALRELWQEHKEDKAPHRRGTLMFQGKANTRMSTMLQP